MNGSSQGKTPNELTNLTWRIGVTSVITLLINTYFSYGYQFITDYKIYRLFPTFI